MIISDAVLVAILASIPPTLTALAGVILSIRNGRKADHIVMLTNGMSDRLVAVNRSDARQQGVTAGVALEREHVAGAPARAAQAAQAARTEVDTVFDSGPIPIDPPIRR